MHLNIVDSKGKDKKLGVLVLERSNRSRVLVLVFINWNLYKKKIFFRVFLSKCERFWP